MLRLSGNRTLQLLYPPAPNHQHAASSSLTIAFCYNFCLRTGRVTSRARKLLSPLTMRSKIQSVNISISIIEFGQHMMHIILCLCIVHID